MPKSVGKKDKKYRAFYIRLKELIDVPEREWQLRDNQLAFEDGVHSVLNAMDRAYLNLIKETT